MSVRPDTLVAVVDDDERILESLEDLLESAGFRARTFVSARAFLESDALTRAACLVSDLRMPDIDGWELEARVSRERPGLPVIFVTGQDSEPTSDARVRLVHGRRIFRKPFDGLELLAAVTRAVQGR